MENETAAEFSDVPMSHVMLDLETLGLRPGCVVLSIGAVFFDANKGLGAEFYEVISRPQSVALGLKEDTGTLNWWENRTAEARKVLLAAADPIAASPVQALSLFNDFLRRGKNVKVWGNGADFDNPILSAVYDAAGVAQGWAPFNGRCYRTLKNMADGPKLKRVGTYHHALDDAKSQALHAIGLFKANRKLVMG